MGGFKVTNEFHKAIKYLRTTVFSGIPNGLFSNSLWLYNELIQISDILSHDNNRCSEMELYSIEIGGEIKGIILKKTYDVINDEEDYLNIYYICSSEYEEVLNFVDDITDPEILVSVVDQQLAAMLKEKLGFRDAMVQNPEYMENINDKYVCRILNHFYKDNSNFFINANSTGCTVLDKKIASKDEKLRVLTNYFDVSGRYNYCKVVKDKIVAKCHIHPSSYERAEVIGVRTMDQIFYKKGYASDCCKFGIMKHINEFEVFNWSCWDYNEASKNLAKSLGFTKYLTEYYLSI